MTTPSETANPLLDASGLIAWDQVTAEHVEPAVAAALASAQASLDDLAAAPGATYATLIPALEAIGDRLGQVWGAVSHLCSVRNSPEMRAAQEDAQPKVVTFWTALGQCEPVFTALQQIRDGAEWAALTPTQQRIVTTELADFELSGIGLQGDERERFNQIQQDLSRLSTSFSNHVLDATKAVRILIEDPARVAGMPERALGLLAANARDDGHEEATAEAGPWVCTLDAPSLMPVLQHASDRSLRAELHRAFATRATDGELNNEPVINEILTLRAEAAKLLGFETWAERSLATKMAPSVTAIDEQLEALRAASIEPAKAELAAVRALAAERGAEEADDLRAWDLGYWTERLREDRYAFSDEELRPYFPLPRVLDGLFAVTKRLFNVEVVAADGEVPVWHPDVRFFRILRDGQTIAACYLDSYARPAEKRGGAWMNNVVDRSLRMHDGGLVVDGLRIPVAVLVCNQAPPTDGKPSLCSFREVETLFHEFGHGLQHMLTTVDETLAAGINKVEWDAVELPSQFMENWCYHRATIMAMSAHVDTGESLPEDLYQKLLAARTFNAGALMLRQILFASTDLELHHRYDPDNADVGVVYRRIADRVALLPPEDYDQFLCGFSHIFAGGYSAGYYSYKWAEILSADAFAAFEEAGLDDDAATAATGKRFADTVLGLGGSQSAAEVFRAFRGRDPSPEALLRHAGLAS